MEYAMHWRKDKAMVLLAVDVERRHQAGAVMLCLRLRSKSSSRNLSHLQARECRPPTGNCGSAVDSHGLYLAGRQSCVNSEPTTQI